MWRGSAIAGCATSDVSTSLVLPPLSRRHLLGAAVSLVAGHTVGAGRVSASDRAAIHVRERAHFVFVHGAFHGAWCWYKVTSALAAAGHQATALDLPSGGIDTTPASGVTLEAQAARVIEVLDTLPTPVVLVGHSAGGAVISTVAEKRPERVAKLVYLTAFLLPNGSSIARVAAEDSGSLLPQNFVATPDGTVFVRTDNVDDVFYGACDEADVALARTLLRPISLLPTVTPVTVGAAFERVRRFYVACRRDRAISPDIQRAMYAALPCEKVFTLNTDHSPFLSRPAALVRALGAIARA